jgi:hypothetical protein
MVFPGITAPCVPDSAGSHAAIRAQLERLLASPAFRNSKRYPVLLRHLVERTLEGRSAELKERVLGVEVFGRPSDYDSNADPIVRTSAGEIRRRIAQYYHATGRESEIRIDLPLGSYVPAFQFPVEIAPVVEPKPPDAVPLLRRLRFPLAALMAAGFLAIAALYWHPWDRPGVIEQFWQPVLHSESAVSLCVALTSSPAIDESEAHEEDRDRPPIVAWADLSAVARLSGLLEAHGQSYLLRRDDSTSMDDLRRAPAVMIGAFNDIWTLRVTDGLRFSFRRDGRVHWIQDSQNPSSKAWNVDYSKRDAAGRILINRDYAVISRVLNARTGKPVITVAGTYGYGTEIAGEFVTSPTLLASMVSRAPAAWQGKNLQIVLSTEVIDRHAGPAHILATHFW